MSAPHDETTTADPHTNHPAPTDTMRSIVQERYGTDTHRILRLLEVPVPAPDDAHVLVRVRAASVDRGTWHVMAGLPYPVRLAGFGVRRPKHPNPGRSFAGTVVAVGGAVHDIAPGDDVYGIAEGALAELVVADPSKLAPRPSNLSFEQAAAVPVSALTALQAARDRARIGPGRSVLVLGASGGVGTFAVQIAKAYGAHVTGVASTAKLDDVRAIGADEVIDYTVTDATAGDRRYDAILDTGGNTPLRHLRRALSPSGTLVIIGGETDGRLLGGTDRQLRAMIMSPFVGQTLGTFISSENAADLEALRELIEAGQVTPVVDRSFPLARTADAIDHLVEGHASGKVVIAV
jgi:NADPH:quinone reductase-like Zn-dependent oxidoreductase